MALLLISEIFPPQVGGSGRWFWEIYSRRRDKEDLIVAGNSSGCLDFDSKHHLKCYRWPLTMNNWGITSIIPLKCYVNLFKKLRKIIKSNNINALHCGRGLPEGLLGWLVWKWFGIPYLCYVHGEELPAYHSSREYTFLSQLVYRNARLIIVNSTNTKNIFVAYTGISDTVRVMHPGVDTTYFTQKERNEYLLHQLGWKGRKIILTIGRLQKRKGHDHVILAMNRIRKQIPNILYAIAGEGEERSYLEKLVTDNNLQDHVQFLGKIDDTAILNCYQQCDLFILANREVNGDFEGFGMVLVEAQSCGKPVIAGNSGGTAETMIEGETGIIIDAKNIEEIADTISTLLGNQNKCEEMGNRATAWVRETLDWCTLLIQAEKIFNELL